MLMRNHEMISDAEAAAAGFSMVASGRHARVAVIKTPFAILAWPAREQREIIIGHSPANRLLVISFTEPAPDVVRIISARSATKREQQDYEENV